ncbi:hypothetical protein [Ligilactobacillus saerimneri]|uniref:hypothetical protein n=1 Tax=Ligilactobacillus saerimneri TaxID=228229 RepID=UPI001C109539|nr:hypothetical protein [Ligilactobacillus saerimneri]MBU5309272.1 hypothetical protein [Ligilactobacillus saerimneri]
MGVILETKEIKECEEKILQTLASYEFTTLVGKHVLTRVLDNLDSNSLIKYVPEKWSDEE